MPSRVSRTFRWVIVALVALLGGTIAACTWVKPTPQGERVRIVPSDRVADCKRLAELSTYTKDEVAGVDRKASKVEKELAVLARNEAAEIGADTIVATSGVVDGRQKFTAYDCL